jgi:hypothetical protein
MRRRTDNFVGELSDRSSDPGRDGHDKNMHTYASGIAKLDFGDRVAGEGAPLLDLVEAGMSGTG